MNLLLKQNVQWKRLQKTFEKILYALVLIGLFFVSIMQRENNSVDLRILLESGNAAINGINPYRELPFYSPAWFLLLLSPLSLLPFDFIHALWTICTLAAWVFILHKLEISVIDSALFMLNPFMWFGMSLGNYDWLVLLGLFLPMSRGIWLLLLKPQIVFGAFLLWLRYVKLKYAIKVFFFPALIILICLGVGLYRSPDLKEMIWNQSLGLWGIPVGLIMMYFAFKRNDSILALGASPFLSPYVGIQSWAIPFLLLTRDRRLLIIGLILSWAFIFVR